MSRDMTKSAALALAVKRWGKKACIEVMPHRCEKYGIPYRLAGKCSMWMYHPDNCPGGERAFKVGRVELGLFFMVKGSGTSFRAAFAEADDRERKEHEEYLALVARRDGKAGAR